MNEEQRRYLAHIGESDTEEILIKRTGWEAINLPTHAHEKFQIIYTLSGTLHIKIGSNNYFVPERHLAWIPSRTKHKVSSNSRQVSLTVFYINLPIENEQDPKALFYIWGVRPLIGENLKFIASHAPCIRCSTHPDLYRYASSFFNLMPQINPTEPFLLRPLIIPNDPRLTPILNYINRHLSDRLDMELLASRFNLSTRNLSRLFHTSGIRFSSLVNHWRILRAIELLTDREKIIQEIAYEVGFNTPNNFNRVFKQITGTSPRIYLQRDDDPDTDPVHTAVPIESV